MQVLENVSWPFPVLLDREGRRSSAVPCRSPGTVKLRAIKSHLQPPAMAPDGNHVGKKPSFTLTCRIAQRVDDKCMDRFGVRAVALRAAAAAKSNKRAENPAGRTGSLYSPRRASPVADRDLAFACCY